MRSGVDEHTDGLLIHQFEVRQNRLVIIYISLSLYLMLGQKRLSVIDLKSLCPIASLGNSAIVEGQIVIHCQYQGMD